MPARFLPHLDLRLPERGSPFLLDVRMPAMQSADIRQRISGIQWFHRIPLGAGVVTPGDDDSPLKLKRLRLPANLSGKTFLDIGAWDGFFSFEAERRGASRVLALDSFVWDGNVPGKSKAGFLAAREILNSKVEDERVDLMEISPERVGTWDVVLLAGVLYHVKNPWIILEKAAAVTREMLILETFTDLRFQRRPAIAIYPTEIIAAGHTENWSGPNMSALCEMALTAGFARVEVVWKSGVGRAVLSACRRFVRSGYSPLRAIQQGRCVIHAYR
jgi:tRNA (mo5U34)-methyltransferase